ncbi:hypothetical protein DRQ50_10905 [bacterium]|nr:MAG: hypothetical protein DRQ50_10905 [bacterium]
MGSNNQGLTATDLDAKLADLAGVNALHAAFGDLAWPVLRRQYLALGYQEGVARLVGALETGDFDRAEFAADPIEGIRAWLQGFFDDRGAAMPDIWREGRTVYLRTKACRECLTVNAEARLPVAHREICYVYCRAWAEGYVQAVADLFPGVVIHYHNEDSRRDGVGHDCVEAFQVVLP